MAIRILKNFQILFATKFNFKIHFRWADIQCNLSVQQIHGNENLSLLNVNYNRFLQIKSIVGKVRVFRRNYPVNRKIIEIFLFG